MQTYVPDSIPIAREHDVSSQFFVSKLLWDRPSADVPRTEGLHTVWKAGSKFN